MNRTATIVIIDDDAGVRESLSSLVRSMGHAVRTYGSAVEFLADGDSADPDCMITDVQMPNMSAEQLQAELIAAGRRFPIICITAFPTPAGRERVMANGACAYLEKPVQAADIARCLDIALQRTATGNTFV